MLKRINLSGNPNLGVYITVNDNIAIVPLNLPKNMEEVIVEAMDLEIIHTTLAGSNLIGALCVGNNNGFLVSPLTTDTEIKLLKEKGVSVERISGKFTAVGNILLTNDKGALCSPLISDDTLSKMEEVLDVDVHRGSIGGFKIVGSVATATNKGVLLNPNADEENIKLIERIFDVPADIGTVNHGYGLIGACSIANSKGVLVGESTTGPEMARIEEALGFLEAF